MVQFSSESVYLGGPGRNIKLSWKGKVAFKVTVERIVCISHQKKGMSQILISLSLFVKNKTYMMPVFSL